MMRIPLALLAVAALFPMAVSAAEPQGTTCGSRVDPADTRPRIGLALGGGGARGVAHISVLRVLEEMHVPVDCIAGTSMGALVGALYASGMSVDEIEKLVLELDWKHMFNDALERPERTYRRKRDADLNVTQTGLGFSSKGVAIAPGLLAGERIMLLFENMTLPVATIADFDDLPIPYRAVAADLNTGQPVILGHGSLAHAMRASMSIPGAFPPMIIDGKALIDGGVARNVPIDVVRAMGADVVIAVDVGTPLATLDETANVLSIAGQLAGLLTVGNTRAQLATLTEDDVLIRPPLGEKVATADFHKGKEALAIGMVGVNEARPLLARYSTDGARYVAHTATRVGRKDEPVAVEFVRLDNRTQYSDEVLLARLDIPLGQPLDAARLEAGLYRIYGFQTMALVDYELVEENGKTGVLVHAKEKLHGPYYLETGLSVSADFDGEFEANLRAGVLASPINRLGGEARGLVQIGSEPGLLAEYYQPLEPSQRYFFFTRLHYENPKVNVFDDDLDKLAIFDVSQVGLTLAAGREFGNYGAALIGVRRATGSAEVSVGDPALPDFDFESGEAFVNFTLDRTDSFYFPRRGYSGQLEYRFSRDALGADTDFEQLGFDAVGAIPLGEHAIQGGMRYHVTTSGTAPIQSLYRLGGITRLVGFNANQVTGQHYAVVFGGFLYHLGDLQNRGMFLGSTLEYGNAWQTRSEMEFDDGIVNGSLYFGFDSWIGAVLFGYGHREGGEGNLFLEVGRRF